MTFCSRYRAAVFGAGLLMLPGTALADPICEMWPKVRDTQLILNFNDIAKKYDAALKKEGLWLDQLNDHIKNGDEAMLRSMEFYDFMLLGASVTAETVALTLKISGAAIVGTGEAVLKGLDRLRLAMSVENSKSVEEAAYRVAGQKSGVAKNALKSLDIFASLLNAKDRFSDRKDTIRLLQKAEKTLRRNHKRSKRNLKKHAKAIGDLNTYKNELDGRCGKIVDHAESCISRGRTPNSARAAHELTNNCSQPVLVFWCYEGTTPKHRKPCGSKPAYFMSQTKLEPGGKQSNFYNMPAGLKLKVGACRGGYNKAIFDGSGGYFCKT